MNLNSYKNAQKFVKKDKDNSNILVRLNNYTFDLTY